MPEIAESAKNPSAPSTKEIFPSSQQVMPCSWNECSKGHKWAVTMVTTPCPGCNSPILATKKENCPYCNEPMVRTSLRSDLIAGGGDIVKRCLGQKGQEDSLQVIFERVQWREAQDNTLFFEERNQAKEAKEAAKQVNNGSNT